jgi:hypothetical protein
MANPSVEDFQAVIKVLSEEASTHKRQTFSLLWILDNESMAFISAGNGELKTTLRAKKPKAEFYEYQFREYNEFLSSFSRLEFILEQTLNLMSTEKPTIKGFIRTNAIISRLGFSVKMTLMREFQPDVFNGIFETMKRLLELRNNLAHNPVPVGVYGGDSLDSKKTMNAVEHNFSQCYNHLVDVYRQHQYKLLNFVQE